MVTLEVEEELGHPSRVEACWLPRVRPVAGINPRRYKRSELAHVRGDRVDNWIGDKR